MIPGPAAAHGTCMSSRSVMGLDLESSLRVGDGACGDAGSGAVLETCSSPTDESRPRGSGAALPAPCADNALVEVLVRALEDPVAALDASLTFLSVEAGSSGLGLQASLRDMQQALGRVQQRLEELAVTFRAKEGALVLRRERVELRAILTEVIAERAQEAKRFGVVVSTELIGSLLIRGDGQLLRLAFRSAFDGALGRCRRGARVLVSARSDGSIEVLISVTGAGSLPLGLSRDDSRHWSECCDAGLRFGGLAVAAHGGDLAVKGGPDDGFVLRVQLPSIASGLGNDGPDVALGHDPT